MSEPLTYVHVGVGGWGQHWCTEVLPRLKRMGLAQAVAAVDINPEALANAQGQLNLSEGQLYSDAEEAIAQTRPDFITIVVPPAFHEHKVDLAIKYDCHILSEKPIADTMDACCRIYKAELFCKWLNGEPAPPNNLDDNIQCAAMLFAAVESAHSGKIVDVQEFLDTHMAQE
jgi:hypothetical protein